MRNPGTSQSAANIGWDTLNMFNSIDDREAEGNEGMGKCK